MMDAVIDVVGVEELPAIVELYNQIFRPQRDSESFRRRYLGRYNVLQMLASVKDQADRLFPRLRIETDDIFRLVLWRASGVSPPGRGHASSWKRPTNWTRQYDYQVMRVECHNHHRPLLHLSIALGYDIVGIRWDSDRGDNLIIFEKEPERLKKSSLPLQSMIHFEGDRSICPAARRLSRPGFPMPRFCLVVWTTSKTD